MLGILAYISVEKFFTMWLVVCCGDLVVGGRELSNRFSKNLVLDLNLNSMDMNTYLNVATVLRCARDHIGAVFLYTINFLRPEYQSFIFSSLACY